jgi:hypothetical protein
MAQKFANWLDTFLEEKGIQLDQSITVQGKSGPNYMEVSHVVDAMKRANANEQNGIKTTFVKIDFVNGDVMHFIKHLAQAIAI